MHTFVIYPYPWDYCSWDEKYKWDSVMRKMLYGAAEICLLCAKLPFISDWDTGRWEKWLWIFTASEIQKSDHFLSTEL